MHSAEKRVNNWKVQRYKFWWFLRLRQLSFRFFEIQNVVTSVVSCSGYSSSSCAIEASQLVDFVDANINNISSITLITGCTFQFMTGPVKIVNKPVLFKRPRRLVNESDDEDWIKFVYFSLTLSCLLTASSHRSTLQGWFCHLLEFRHAKRAVHLRR